MSASPLRVLLLFLVFLGPAGLPADQEALDELARQEEEKLEGEDVSVYAGQVAGAEAIFFIEWPEGDEAVEGRYYLPVRGKNFLYILKGRNPKAGVLELEEFVDDGSGTLVPNAKCALRKQAAEDRIVWEGEKTYENGLLVSISFSRPK